MNKIGLIIKREYLRRVSKKSFLLLTFLTPFLFAALVFVPLWLSTIKGDDVKQVAISDTTGKYAERFVEDQKFRFVNDGDDELYFLLHPFGQLFQFLVPPGHDIKFFEPAYQPYASFLVGEPFELC